LPVGSDGNPLACRCVRSAFSAFQGLHRERRSRWRRRPPRPIADTEHVAKTWARPPLRLFGELSSQRTGCAQGSARRHAGLVKVFVRNDVAMMAPLRKVEGSDADLDALANIPPISEAGGKHA
jgi:hypothetical protein